MSESPETFLAHHTLAEAREKLCPLMPTDKVKEHVGGGFYGGREYTATCAASRCMMWRWITPDTPTPNENMRGYCGIAGRLQPSAQGNGDDV
jgi:hypothetical protein